MRSPGFPAALVVVTVLAAGCGTGVEDGTGFLTVTDLSAPFQPRHFDGAPARVLARLAVTATGCVTVTVDDVIRMPFWPGGTRVEDSHEKPGDYSVTLPGGPTLKASGATGDTFAAQGVIDEEGRAFDAGGKVDGLLGFCAVKAAPIAFRDASTVTRAGAVRIA